MSTARSDFRLIAVLSGLAIVIAAASLMIGAVPLGPGTVIGGLVGSAGPVDTLIVRELRLPRTLLAGGIGATLALAGAAMQGLMRNPLAAPDILGAPGAAALGAVIALAAGLADTVSFALPLAAVAMALTSAYALVALSGRAASLSTLLLAGLALSSLWGALISLTLNLAPSLYAALEITFWLLGSLEDRSFRHVAIAAPFLVGGSVLLLATRHHVRALSLGEDVARSSGIDMGRLQWTVMIGTAACIGGGVAVAGVIGFVGLVVPHLVRPLVGHDPARVHVPAMIAGASLLMAADCLARLIPSHSQIHIGVITSLIGIPFFIRLVVASRHRTSGAGSAP